MDNTSKETMQGSLKLLNSMQLTEKTAGLDSASKEMFHNIEVVFFIMRKVVPEYREYSIDDIKGS